MDTVKLNNFSCRSLPVFITYFPINETDILNKLRCPKIFQPLTVNTVRFKKAFFTTLLKQLSVEFTCYDILTFEHK